MAQATQTTSAASGSCPTLPPEKEAPALFQNGVLTFQAHHVGWIVASFFAIVATSVSVWLILKHLTWYTNKMQQRQIVRLLLMVPIYSIISCLAYFFWNHAIPLSLIRDAYEGIILASFFYLLLQYLATTPTEQKEYFRHYTLEKWAWPFGWVKRKPEGLYFLQLMKWAILQYCWVRPLTTFGAVIMNMIGIYCEQSWSPRFGSVWILMITSVAVSVAMFCLIQFYLSISDRIKQYKPLLQLFSIKAIIFLMFWQSSFLSALHSFNVIKDTKYMNAEDINTGLAALLQTFEMVLFAFLHVRCFSYIPYRKNDRTQMTPKGAALAHALDFRDFWYETRDGLVYMWRKMRGKEAEIEARRKTHFERAMGKSRIMNETKKELPEPHVIRSDDSDDEGTMEIPSRLLLGTREEQPWALEKEKASQRKKEKRDAKNNLLPIFADEERGGHEPRQRSWWSRMYGRLSTDDPELDPPLPTQRRQPSGGPSNIPIRSSNTRVREHALRPVDLDEPPPPSLLGRGHKRGRKSGQEDPNSLSAEKQPFLDWSPSITLPVRPVDKGFRVDLDAAKDLPPHPRTGEMGEKLGRHDKEDTVLGRIFAQSPDLSGEEDTHEQEGKEKHRGLPSLFQKRHDIAKAVKGWDLSSPKAAADPAVAPPLPAKTAAISAPREEDIPSIPSLSPSPPGRPSSSQILNVLSRTSPPAPTPAQPVPVLHDSLSRARRPGVLIADEAGVSPPTDLILTQSRPRERVEKWVESTSMRMEAPPVAPPPMKQVHHRPGHSMGSMPPPVDSMRHRSYGTKGPKKPAKIVLPTPLSPARWPGGAPQQPMGMNPMAPPMPNPYVPRDYNPPSRLPPGASIGQRPMYQPEFGFNGPPAPSQFYSAPPPATRSRNMAPPAPAAYQFNPYEQFGPPGFDVPGRQNPNERPSRAQRREHRQPVRQEPGRGGIISPGGSRSRSPFSIGISPTSDTESLPRHPALRRQTARRRQESQPPPNLPPGAAPPSSRQTASKRPRRRSEPLQTSYNADMSSSPPVSPALLINAIGTPSSASPLGDSRYPRATSRENYFDSYDTVSPYLTNIMTDVMPPPPPVLGGKASTSLPVSGPSSPTHRSKRR